MKMKRFFAKDMRSALLEVKEALGSDAVIMSNKKVTGGIEIVAAVDYGTDNESLANARELAEDSVNISSAVSKKAAPQPKVKAQKNDVLRNFDDSASLKDNLADFLRRQQRNLQDVGAKSLPPTSASSQGHLNSTRPKTIAEQQQWKASRAQEKKSAPLRRQPTNNKDEQTQAIDSLRSEMAEMRKLLEHQVSGLMFQEVEREEPVRAMMIKELQRLGFADILADQLASLVPESCSSSEAWQHVHELLAAQLETGDDDVLLDGGAIALLGPTGVGKTTTIAKLAARFAKRYGAEQVAMITTDTYRIGAHEQLSTYGKIMGCPVRVAKDENELSELLYQFREKRLVLIDTAGMSQRDLRLNEQLDALVKNSRVNIRSYLVMSANAQRRVIEETVQHFSRIPLAGAILTKLDESLSLAEVLNVALTNALPISYITNGQRVPEDIAVADPYELVAQALASGQDNSSYYWPLDNRQG
ncbi:flagellar biosynthesis protein FlhF [Celerinatantimonas yamalensis]|uniref:Flagellar biosynthesis protein FlhF n=1 Tax=Celerinatantimonas yamalensis TaxID=559956 RepID=A0ABW9G6M3_9GAMM